MKKNKSVTQQKHAIKEVTSGAFTQVQLKFRGRKAYKFPMEITESSKHLENKEKASLWLTSYLRLHEFI